MLEVAQNQRRLGHDADRVAEPVEHFEDPAHHLMLALDRLVRIGVGADRDCTRHVSGGGKLAFEQPRRFRLCEQLRFEIKSGRQAEIGVGGPREAVDAAVLAPTIRIDRAIEGNVGRVVAGDDLARRIDRHRSLERRQLLETLPAVVEEDSSQRLITARRIRLRTTAMPAQLIDGGPCIGWRIEVDRSRSAHRHRARTPALRQPV